MKKLRTPPKMPTAHKRRTTTTRRPDPGSNVEAHEYSPETGHLTVTYKGGRQYRYQGVPQEIADGLESAQSKGSYLHSSVIGKFKHDKI